MTQYVTLDLETTQIRPGKTPDIHCVGIVWGERHPANCVLQWGEAARVKLVQLLSADVTFVIQNAAFDVRVLRHHGVNIPQGRYVCTMVAAHAINPQQQSYSLETYGATVGDEKVDYEQALVEAGMWKPERKDDKGFYDIPFNPYMERYCLQDCLLTTRLWRDCQAHLDADQRLAGFFWGVALPYVEVMMSLTQGLHVDLRQMLTLATDLMGAINAKTLEFEEHYPRCVAVTWNAERRLYVEKQPVKYHAPNLGSPNDVCSLLMSHGWVPDDFKRHTGKPVTSQNTLKRLIATPDVDPKLKLLAERITELRSMIGIQQQCIQMLTLTEASTGMLYGNWHQTGTKTGRMSSSTPNMQNISTRHPLWGQRMRECFTPPKGYAMLCGDLSQIELGILAYYLEMVCGDSAMADGNRAGRDAHDTNTFNWYGVDKDDPAFKAFRAKAKNGVFAAGYGAMAHRLSLTLNISLSEAQEILNVVDDTTEIVRLKQFMWERMRQTKDIKPIPIPGTHRKTTKGVFYDFLGSRGFYPLIDSPERWERSSAERQSFNALCQRGCASILYSLLNQCFPTIDLCGGWVAGVVHDEALIYVPLAAANDVVAKCNEVFNSLVMPTPQGGVYVRAEFHVVQSWADK